MKKKSFERARLYSEYSSMSKDRFDKIMHHDLDPKDSISVEEDKDNILSLIFAPDPLTGFPRSDLALIMSKDAAPEVSQYIRETLMKPISDIGPSGAPDADTALDTMRAKNEGLTEYAERLRSIVAKYNEKSE